MVHKTKSPTARRRERDAPQDGPTQVVATSKVDYAGLLLEIEARKYTKYLDAQAQHGPVKVLWKDGKPVQQEEK